MGNMTMQRMSSLGFAAAPVVTVVCPTRARARTALHGHGICKPIELTHCGRVRRPGPFHVTTCCVKLCRTAVAARIGLSRAKVARTRANHLCRCGCP
jgi:hypothetical protein